MVVSLGHPDHCADLHPLLRARALRDTPAPPLVVHTLPQAVDQVLALDRPGMLDDAHTLHEFAPGDRFQIGPFRVETRLLPHSVLSVGIKLTAGRRTLAYTGDTGPSQDLETLARNADLFLAEATFPEHVPADSARYLSSAKQAGELSSRADVKHLMLTHLWPGTDPHDAEQAARRGYGGTITVARAGVVVDLE